MSRRRGGRPPRADLPVPKRPYRDSALVNAGLAAALLAVAWVTGGSIGRAVVVGALFFVVATAYSWWRFKQRLERERGDGRG